MLHGETKDSHENRNHDAWEPEWIDGRFACLMECTACTAATAVAGAWRLEDRGYNCETQQGHWDKVYLPKYFSEAPHIIPLPAALPEAVRDELIRSFVLYWVDSEACGNRIRRAVEQLMTDHRIRRTVIVRKGNKPGKRKPLDPHKRIEAFGVRRPELSDALIAVKWIGNAGSHLDQLSCEDVLDGYELLSYVLDELYVPRAKRAKSLAKVVNRRKGPRSPRNAKG